MEQEALLECVTFDLWRSFWLTRLKVYERPVVIQQRDAEGVDAVA